MRLTPKEQEKLMLHMAGNLAKERKERGVKLNYVESLAYISSELLELARDGKTVVELMQLGTKILTKKDVMDGVADDLRANLEEGGQQTMKIGEIIPADREITLNEGKNTVKILVANKGDRPVQVGSHYHFFEVNKCLSFDRETAYGYHLDIPSGTSVRFEPGEEKEVQLTQMGGRKRVFGLNDLTRARAEEDTKKASMEKAALKGFV